MSRLQVTWVIKNQAGQVKGPYSTEAILRMITDGHLSGQELISKMPDGKWTSISREPEFYDRLLEALEGASKPQSSQDFSEDAETVIVSPPPAKAKLPLEKTPEQDKKQVVEILEAHNQISSQAVAQSLPKQSPSSVIELNNVAGVGRAEIFKKIKIPLVALCLAILAGVVLLLSTNTQKDEKISLLMPNKGQPILAKSIVDQKFRVAMQAIERDTFESYVEAENQLVAIVEGAPTNLEVRALLCYTYKELWPFAKQDANDIKVIAAVTQNTKSLNVVSSYGNVCEIVKFLTSGRFNEARSVVDSTLENNDKFSLQTLLYFIKAELMLADKDYQNAIPYFEKAAQLWDTWLKPRVMLGVANAAFNQAAIGSQYLRQVLENNPGHRVARAHLGLIEYKSFKKNDSAYNLLISAAENKSRMDRALESETNQALAEILLERGDRKKALVYAQKAMDLNPNNLALKQLVVRLGGSDKIKNDKNANNELMFTGDQYARQGDYLAAQAEYKAAFEADHKNGTAAMKAAKCLWLLNQSYDAVEWLNRAIKAEPNLISAYVLQADYLSQRYDFAGALQTLSNATRMTSNNYEVLRGFALLEFRKNNMIAAVNYAMRSLKVYDGDVDTYILLAKANASLASGISPFKNSEIEKKQNAQKDAIRYATKAVELDATSVDAQIAYAKVLAQVNGVDSGISYVRELIKKFSYSLEYRIALAEIYKSEDRFTQAKEVYEQVADADPKNKAAWLGLGECYRTMGVIDKALRAFLTAAILDPSDGEALFQAGKVYLESNRFNEAISQFKRVQASNPNFPRTYYYIGKAAFGLGQFNAALEAANLEKKRNPNLADSYILSAEVLYTMKQYGDCAAEYSLATKLRPQGADIYVKAAQCYRQSGSIDVAEDMLTLASARESGNADIYKEQGAIYEVKGDAASAIQAYNKYLGLSPNATDRAEIEFKMRRLGGR